MPRRVARDHKFGYKPPSVNVDGSSVTVNGDALTEIGEKIKDANDESKLLRHGFEVNQWEKPAMSEGESIDK